MPNTLVELMPEPGRIPDGGTTTVTVTYTGGGLLHISADDTETFDVSPASHPLPKGQSEEPVPVVIRAKKPIPSPSRTCFLTFTFGLLPLPLAVEVIPTRIGP